MQHHQVRLGRRTLRLSVTVLLTAVVTPAAAAERTLSIADFDRLRVDGAFVVEVREGRATSAKVMGTQAAIDAVSAAVQGRQLTIRRASSGWGGKPGQTPPAATIRITTPLLSAVAVSGSAKVDVARLKGLRVAASLEGAGALTIAQVDADRTDLATLGAGTLTVAGATKSLTIITRGASTFDARALMAHDVKLTSESAGTVTVAAARTADITMTGVGSVTVTGKPACTVKNIGSGTVICGSDKPQRR